jgi:hypothetical protein
MKLSGLQRILLIAFMLVTQMVAGCSTTPLIVNEWRNPAYEAPSFKSVMVGGLSEQTTMRRNLEDEFLAQLKTAGVEALASYRHGTEIEKFDEVKLKEAARQAGADALIIARSVKVEQKTDYGPSYYPVPIFGIFGRHVSGVWHGGYGGPSVTRYTEYTSETTLYDVAKDQVVWSATLKTSEPENTNSAIKSYVEAVMDALKEKKSPGHKKIAISLASPSRQKLRESQAESFDSAQDKLRGSISDFKVLRGRDSSPAAQNDIVTQPFAAAARAALVLDERNPFH